MPTSLTSSLVASSAPTVLALLLFAVAASASEPATTDPPAASNLVQGVLVRVTALEPALDFYTTVAGFEKVHVGAGKAELKNGDVHLWLIEVAQEVRHELPGPAESHLNVQIGVLEETLGHLAQRGIRFLASEPLGSPIGPNMPIADPAGNLLYVVQLDSQKEALEKPAVFNFGVTIPKMAEARSFYEGLLGFKVYSEAYYPPVIPYLKSGAMQVVLHESATGAAPPPPPDRAQMNLVVQVGDLAAQRATIEAAGGRFRSCDPRGPLGSCAELLDPFGNVIVLVERPANLDSQSSR